MAHGNASDLIFFALLAVVVQWFAFPNTLFEDLGPLKAQLKTKSSDLDTLIKFGGGLLLMIGLTLSGVKWNPINGKMAGAGGFLVTGYTAFSTFSADGHAFVPRLFYVYALVLFLGMLHIFAFASNPLVKAVDPDNTKNNHGNFSDMAALGLIVASLVCLFTPGHLCADLGPFKAQFSNTSADLIAMIRFVGGLMLIIALMLSGVKWNPINGKMAGFGGFIASIYTIYTIFSADSNAFVPRLLYVYAALIFFSAVHIFAFPSNPLPPKKSEKAEASKAA